MRKKYETMIYPFDSESIPLIRHSNLIYDIKITHIISPNGWGFVGKDAGCADKGQPIGIIVDNDFCKALENCDTVFFTEFSRSFNLDKFIYPKIIKAAKNSKNIICTIKLEGDMVKKIKKLCNENNKIFKYFSNDWENIIHTPVEEIYRVNTPVIFVTGLGEKTHKFEIQLRLRENLEKMGYKVSQIGTRHYCELMHFHSFPKFMYSKAVTECEKVTLFNYYVKNIEVREKPDVIVIGIPGGTMPFNYKFTNKFGILAYEVSQAVVPDAVVLSTLYSKFSSDFFDSISKSYKYKFGYDIDCYNISNLSLNHQTSQLERSLQYITMDWDFVNDSKKLHSTSNRPVYNILDENDGKSMAEFIVNKLSKYVDTEAI